MVLKALEKSKECNPHSTTASVQVRERSVEQEDDGILHSLSSPAVRPAERVAVLPEERPDVPRELKRRRRGRQVPGSKPRQEETVPARPPLHHHGERVRSLPNKMDELAALTRHQREYRECSLLLFTETWLTALTPDTAAELDGFTLLRADRSKESAVSRLQTQHPDALLLISGDFNHASPSSSLPKFTHDAHGEDIDSLTHCLTDYINFCVENTVPTRTVRSFSNSKPWITPDIKALLKEKRRAFVSGNKEELKSVQRELRRMIRKGKDCYRRKMEHQLQQNNICGVWKGLKTISGFKARSQSPQPVGDQGWANDLNLFFNRFDQASAPPQPSLLCCNPHLALCPLSTAPPVPPPPSHDPQFTPLPLPPSHDPQFTPTLSSHLP
ncbi:hypothetical protein L3Q82_008108 [Scortum barcoo]|uniref:Uncharacterized protein n=1 Tax=Scortum barcoo TaxID=214431 RepID=A0ACB8WJZ7_9TELE|nr:hypothetical protein L3Q82_008108 [Scortum barcoo]